MLPAPRPAQPPLRDDRDEGGGGGGAPHVWGIGAAAADASAPSLSPGPLTAVAALAVGTPAAPPGVAPDRTDGVESHG